MQLPKMVSHPGGFDVGTWCEGRNEHGNKFFRVWFHHYLQANQFRSFSRYVELPTSTCPAFVIADLFRDKLEYRRFELAIVQSMRIRGRHLMVTPIASFPGILLLVKTLGHEAKIGTILFRQG